MIDILKLIVEINQKMVEVDDDYTEQLWFAE